MPHLIRYFLERSLQMTDTAIRREPELRWLLLCRVKTSERQKTDLSQERREASWQEVMHGGEV
jgi:hypothetical protein